MDLEKVSAIARALCARNGWGKPTYIDHGNSAAVFRVQHPTHGLVALKIYDPFFFDGENALIEAKRVELQNELKEHDCPCLINIIETGQLSSEGTHYLLMEYCDWSSLEKELHKVPDNNIALLLKQLVEAVLFLEAKGLVHRDIKPANILVSKDFSSIKLLDLGVLRKILPQDGSGTDCDDKRRFIATAQYSPPEYLTRDELSGVDGFNAINLYQVGAVLHDMLMKIPLFQAESQTKNKYILYKAVTTKQPRLANKNVSPGLVALCRAALDKVPSNRIRRLKLEDFLVGHDDPDAIRRRLSGAENSATRADTPSIHLWRDKARSWISAAARAEKAILGPFTLPEKNIPNGLRWTVSFSDGRMCAYYDLISSRSNLVLQVVSDTVPPVAATVLEINAHGPDMEQEAIIETLAANMLYVLDLAKTQRE